MKAMRGFGTCPAPRKPLAGRRGAGECGSTSRNHAQGKNAVWAREGDLSGHDVVGDGSGQVIGGACIRATNTAPGMQPTISK